jgi:hypothetical protein
LHLLKRRIESDVKILTLKWTQEYALLVAAKVKKVAAEKAMLDLGDDRGLTSEYIATDDLLNEFGITVNGNSILNSSTENEIVDWMEGRGNGKL